MELTLHGKFGGPLAPTELAVMLIRVVASGLLVSRARHRDGDYCSPAIDLERGPDSKFKFFSFFLIC